MVNCGKSGPQFNQLYERASSTVPRSHVESHLGINQRILVLDNNASSKFTLDIIDWWLLSPFFSPCLQNFEIQMSIILMIDKLESRKLFQNSTLLVRPSKNLRIRKKIIVLLVQFKVSLVHLHAINLSSWTPLYWAICIAVLYLHGKSISTKTIVLFLLELDSMRISCPLSFGCWIGLSPSDFALL